MENAFLSARDRIGDVAPKLAELTDDLLFGDVWERPGLNKRDRSLVTVAALIALYRTNEMAAHVNAALDHGVTVDELIEAITHLAFYASWPNAQTAITTFRSVLEARDAHRGRS